MVLDVGSKAPDFELIAHDGSKVRLSDLHGHYVVLYFYPRTGTSGCTREARGFNELYDEFKKLGVVVFRY